MRVRLPRAVGSLALTVTLAIPPVVLAEPAADPANDTAATADAQRLYEQGRARYDLLDYKGAIALWTQAYSVLPFTEDNRVARNLLAYNIASAQEKFFELDGDVTHLRQAKGLLEKYLGEHKKLYRPTDENRAEADRVQTRIDELQARIAAASETNAATPGGANPATTQATARQPSPAQLEKQKARAQKTEAQRILREDPELAKQYNSGQKLMITGIVFAGVGGVTVIAGGYAFDPSLTVSPAVAGTLIGVGLLIAIPGVILIPVGVKRKRAARHEATKRIAWTPAPLVLRDGAGLGIVGRF